MEESSFGHGPKIAALVGTLSVTALVAWWLRPADGFGAKKAAGASDLNSLFQSFAGTVAGTVAAPGAASTHAPTAPVPNLGTLLQSLGNAINPSPPAPAAPHGGKPSPPPRASAAPASGSAAAPKPRKKSSSATSSASSNTPTASPNASANTFETTAAPTDTGDDGGELLSDELNPFYTG